MPLPPRKPTPERRIFVSYAHKDHEHVRDLLRWVNPLCRRLEGINATWVDYEGLKGGDVWNEAIEQAIARANVFLVLMSIDYVDSDYCRSHELLRMLQKQARGEALVVGIALRPVTLSDFQCNDEAGAVLRLDRLQCLPQATERVDRDGDKLGLKPILLWPEHRRDLAWQAVQDQLERALLADTATPIFAAPNDAPTFVEPPADVPAAAPATRITAGATLLPYLADRWDQSYELADALQRWEAQGFARPLVVLTDGRPQDCLDRWVERMHSHEFDAALRSQTEGLAFGHFKPFAWPSTTRALAQPADAHRHFERALADGLGPRPVSPLAEVIEGYVTRARPTLLWTQCAERAPAAHAVTALRGLLDLLGRWPALARHSMMVLALNIERQAGAPFDQPSALSDEFKGVLAQAQADGSITLAALGALPELDLWMIQRWAEEHVGERLRDEVDQLCSQHLPADRDTWPMREFALKARAWISAIAAPARP